MSENKLGLRVSVTYSPESIFALQGIPGQIFRNVTEIHYNYLTPSIAFESDVHRTGQTHQLKDVLEFEAVSESEKAETF